MRRRLYLMRHAEAAYFGPDGVPGDLRAVPLSEAGRLQALAVGEAFAPIPFDRVITSGLLRTVETARLVLGDRPLALESAAGFEEVRIGEGEGLPEMAARVIAAFEEVIADPSWQQLLLVAHAMANRSILSRVLGTDQSVYGRIEQDPACVNVIDLEPPLTGDSSHLVARALNVTTWDPLKRDLRATMAEMLSRS